ncbi:MAG: histidine kinase, partial [Chitinophagaceae bacterium]
IQHVPSYQAVLPKMVVDKVQLFLTDIDLAKKGTFAYDENNLGFHFTGVSFSHPEKIRYQYKLQGFSNEWMTTKDNSVNFPKLPPGQYNFFVRASLNNQFSAGSQASYSFTIRKPFWLQWWFISVAILVVAGTVYWFIKLREKRAQRWERIEKEKIQSQFETLKSQVNPHFLFNSFNTLISVIEENPESAVEYTEHLSDLYRKIVTYRDNDTITLGEEINLINDYFFIQKKRFGNHLTCTIDLKEEDLKNYRIAPLTLQLLCENAVKHNAVSSETPLIIRIFVQADQLVVQNNINKKLTTEIGAGMGLRNIQNRYRHLSKKEFGIEKTNKEFIVYIPLLLSSL